MLYYLHVSLHITITQSDMHTMQHMDTHKAVMAHWSQKLLSRWRQLEYTHLALTPSNNLSIIFTLYVFISHLTTASPLVTLKYTPPDKLTYLQTSPSTLCTIYLWNLSPCLHKPSDSSLTLITLELNTPLHTHLEPTNPSPQLLAPTSKKKFTPHVFIWQLFGKH